MMNVKFFICYSHAMFARIAGSFVSYVWFTLCCLLHSWVFILSSPLYLILCFDQALNSLSFSNVILARFTRSFRNPTYILSLTNCSPLYRVFASKRKTIKKQSVKTSMVPLCPLSALPCLFCSSDCFVIYSRYYKITYKINSAYLPICLQV